MKLSTKGRYGLKAMFDLALNSMNGPESLTNISDRQKISLSYLEQLIAQLRKAGLVKSIRGAQGGYLLAKEPADITVGDIIRTLEGPLYLSECIDADEKQACGNADYCVTKIIWEKMRDSFNSVIDSITLQDMMDDHYRLHNIDTGTIKI